MFCVSIFPLWIEDARLRRKHKEQQLKYAQNESIFQARTEILSARIDVVVFVTPNIHSSSGTKVQFEHVVGRDSDFEKAKFHAHLSIKNYKNKNSTPQICLDWYLVKWYF